MKQKDEFLADALTRLLENHRNFAAHGSLSIFTMRSARPQQKLCRIFSAGC
ncbi:MAG: hypothetical protein ACT4P0_12090 [Panacagrimonas sp.]